MKRISMKTTFGLAVALLATACTNELADKSANGTKTISFQIPQTETRAAVNNADDMANGFEVWGWYKNETSGPHNVFNGVTVSKKNDSWGYDEQQYWSPGFIYDFYGVYPADLPEENVTVTSDGNITITDFDCSKFGTDAVDLMTASRIGMNGSNPKKVALTFKHALTRITFSAKLADGLDKGYSLQVKEVALWASNKGDMTQNMNQTDSQPVWETQPYLQEGDNEGDINEEYNAYLYRLTSSDGALIADPISKGDAVPLNVKGKGDLLVVPQEMNYTRPVLAINYTLSYGESTSTAIWKVYPLKGNTDWTPGTSLNYTFTIDEDNAYFNVNVGDWKDGNLGKEEIVFE